MTLSNCPIISSPTALITEIYRIKEKEKKCSFQPQAQPLHFTDEICPLNAHFQG